MKCLSVCQPFANLIIQGKKTIELRKWNTKFRGEFLVHASRKIRIDDCKRLKIKPSLTTGAIIGKIELVDVKKYENDSYDSKYGFILENPKKFSTHFPCNGKLNFFEFKPELVKIDDVKMELFEEEHRYMWINHH